MPHAALTGVQKAPRHEVAGSWAPAGQRALWKFDADGELGGELDDRGNADRIRAGRVDVREVGGVR